MADELNLKTKDHPRPYILSCLRKGNEEALINAMNEELPRIQEQVYHGQINSLDKFLPESGVQRYNPKIIADGKGKLKFVSLCASFLTKKSVLTDLHYSPETFDDLKPLTHILAIDITSKKWMKLLHEGIRYLVNGSKDARVGVMFNANGLSRKGYESALSGFSARKLERRSCVNSNALAFPDAILNAVKCTEDVMNFMKIGETNRARCSRSYSVLSVHVRGEDATGSLRRNCLHLVDLAGSERDEELYLTNTDGHSAYSLGQGSKEHTFLRPDQIDYRRLMVGDLVLINRSPTTHKLSLQALTVYTLDEYTSLKAKAETRELFSVEEQLLNSHTVARQLVMQVPNVLPGPAIKKSSTIGQLKISKREAALSKKVQQIGIIGVQMSDRRKFYSETLVKGMSPPFQKSLVPYQELVHSIPSGNGVVRRLIVPRTLFKEIEQVREGAYKIKLPDGYGILDTFNIADLSPYYDEENSRMSLHAVEASDTGKRIASLEDIDSFGQDESTLHLFNHKCSQEVHSLPFNAVKAYMNKG
ncbi:hypothetical protein ACS0TY_030811 [Phlomoides rotata]